MSDVDPLGNAYCEKHDIYLCEECCEKLKDSRTKDSTFFDYKLTEENKGN